MLRRTAKGPKGLTVRLGWKGLDFLRRTATISLVGSRNGAVPLGSIYPLLSVSFESASLIEP